MTDYLAEAAALLRRAAADNETENGSSPSPAWSANPGREQIAMKFAQLAAIERGVIPAEMVAELLREIAGGDR